MGWDICLFFGGMRTSSKTYIMIFLEKLFSLLLESVQFVLWKCCDPIQNIFINIPNLTCDFMAFRDKCKQL